MANRRSYGNNSGGGGGGFNSRFIQQGNNMGNNINPWQAGSSPGRGGNIPSLFNQMGLGGVPSPDAQLALATKLLSQLLPNAGGNPPSLMGGGGGPSFGSPGNRFGGGGGQNFPQNSRFRGRNDDRRGNDQGFNKNRRQQNDRGPRRNRNDKNKQKDGAAAGNKASQDKKAQAAKKVEAEVKTEPEEKMETDTENEVEIKEKPTPELITDTEEEGENKKKEKEGPLPEYEGIPAKLFHCHVCGKNMWNDVSFDFHIKGRNHQEKLRALEESYQMQTNLMRESAAISLKLEEVRRGKRRSYADQYCKMCDLHFNGMTMFGHRSTEEHQSLKKFIHPSCALCVADFKARLEYDEHILTPEHLKNEAKLQTRKEQYEKDPQYIALRQEEAKFRFQLEELTALTPTVTKLSDEDKKGLTELNLPAFDPDAETPLGADQVSAVEGFLCKACKVFVLSRETADLHLKTQKHHDAFVSRALDRLNRMRKEKENEDKRKNTNKDEGSDAKKIKIEGEDAVEEVETNGGAEEAEAKETVNEAANESAEGGDTDTQQTASETESTPATPRRATARRGRGRGRK